MKRADTFVVVPYNPAWAAEFERFRRFLLTHIADGILRIDHVGSTAVPGLAAKPILDVDVVIPSRDVFPGVKARLEALGFLHEGDLGVAEREAFKRLIPDDFMDYHLYVCPQDSRELARHLAFRDILRRFPDAANAYSALKTRLFAACGGDRNRYSAGKTDFVTTILRQYGKESLL